MGIFSPTPDSTSPFGWRTVRWQPTTLTGTFDEIVFTPPAGTTILDVFMVCVRGDTGATTTTIDLEWLAPGGTAILTGASDNAGTAGLTTWFASEAARKTAVDAGNVASLNGTAPAINAEVTVSGTYTVAPIMEIHVLCGRIVEP